MVVGVLSARNHENFIYIHKKILYANAYPILINCVNVLK